MPLFQKTKKTAKELRDQARVKRLKKKAEKLDRKQLEQFYSDRMMQERGIKKEQRFYEAALFKKNNVRPEPPNELNHYPAEELRNQARFMYQNDAIGRRAVDLVVSNVVGPGIVPIFQGHDSKIKLACQRAFDIWSSSTVCDYDGVHNFAGLESLVVRTTCRDGSCFVIENHVKGILKLQVLEPEYLNTFINKPNLENGGEVRNGIEYDRYNRRSAYYFYEHHPDDYSVGASFEIDDPRGISVGHAAGKRTIKIPAKRVAHVYRSDRASQQDGFSWLGPCLDKLWDLREYEEAKLIQQKLQCSITAFVMDNYSLSEEEREDFLGEPRENSESRSIKPGTVEELPTGKSVVFPPQAATPNEAFVERSIRAVASTLGLSYEAFNDYSQVNFSSGRMGFIEMDRAMKNTTNSIFVPRFLNPVTDWFLKHAVYQRYIPRDHGLSVNWVLPAREMIDPQKEIETLLTLWGSNVVSAKYVHARLGLNFDKNLEEIVESKKVYKELGLAALGVGYGEPTTDPRIVAENEEDKLKKKKKELEEKEEEIDKENEQEDD